MDELKYLRREVEVKDANHVERTIEDLLYEIEWLRADNTRLRELVVNVRNKEDIWCPPIPLPILDDENNEAMSRVCHQDDGIKRLRAISDKYTELLMLVHNKYPDESRHETAARILKQGQESDITLAAKGGDVPVSLC